MSKKFVSLEERREYQRVHYRVNRVLGKATEYHCQHCDGDAVHWAQIHGRDGHDPENDFLSLCSICHQKYDNKWSQEERAKLSATLKAKGHRPPSALGVKRSEETKQRMSEAQLASWARRKGVAK